MPLISLLGIGIFASISLMLAVLGHLVAGNSKIAEVYGLVALGLGALIAVIAGVARYRLVLREETIEYRGFFKTISVRLTDIVGYRLRGNNKRPTLELQLRGQSRKSTRIALLSAPDPVLQNWLSRLPDLDAAAFEAEDTELSQDYSLGATKAQRVARLARARSNAALLGIIGVVLGVWGLIYPEPRQLVTSLLALLPIMALAVRAAGGKPYTLIGAAKRTAYADLSAMIVLPTLALANLLVGQDRLLDWQPLLGPAGWSCGLLIAATVLLERGRVLSISGALALLTMLVASCGVAVMANQILDFASSQSFEVTLTARRVGLLNATTVGLAPFDAYPATARLELYGARFRSLQVGDKVTVIIHPGALKARWFSVEARSDARAL